MTFERQDYPMTFERQDYPLTGVESIQGITTNGVRWVFTRSKAMPYWKAALSVIAHLARTIYETWRYL